MSAPDELPPDPFPALLSLQSTGLLLEQTASSRHLVIEMMRHYMRRLGIEESILPPVVHVAGTKGKGSTCALTESILRHHGYSTGASCGGGLSDGSPDGWRAQACSPARIWSA